MKKILASPKVMRGKSIPSVNKTFGVPLEVLTDRDNVDVPLIITRICEYLKKNGLNQEGLFRVNGNMKVVERLKVAFDKCGDADLEETGDVPAAASLLKLFLRELSDPVIPDDLQRVLIAIQDKYGKDKRTLRELMQNLITKMPYTNRLALKYLCAFMLVIAENCEKNKMTALALAIVFGPSLFRCGEGLEGLKEQAFVNAVLLQMLQDYEFIFSEDGSTNDVNSPGKPAAYLEHVRQKKEKNKEKPARPPPPQLNMKDFPMSIVAKSTEKDVKKQNNSKVSKKKTMDHLKTPQKRKGPSSEGGGNISPTTTFSSPLTKQLLDSTINSAVKEHLFGPSLLTQSTESDTMDDLIIQQSSKEREIYEDSLQYSNSNNSMEVNFGDSPTKKISEKDLAYIKQHSQDTLPSLTSNRVGPPKNRRRPSSLKHHTTKKKSKEPVAHRTYKSFEEEKFMSSELVTPEVKNHSFLQEKDDSFLITPLKSKQRDETEIADIVPPINISRLIEEENEPPKSPRDRFKYSHQEDDFELPSVPTKSNVDSPQGRRRHEQWMEKRQDTVPIVEMSPQDLKKRIVSLKKIIQNFESNFESQNGVKPTPSDKAPIQKYIAELGRTKKQLKELLSDYHENLDLLSETAPIGTDLGTSPNLRESIQTELSEKESTLHLLLRRLEEKRSMQGRPQEIQTMTMDQLKDEKLSVQKALLQYENLHGRPTTKEDKTLMRPLYDRYRKIKRLIASGKVPSNDAEMLSTNYSQNSSTKVGSPLHLLSNNNAFISEDEKEAIYTDSSHPSSPLRLLEEKKSKKNSGTMHAQSFHSNETPSHLADTFSLTRRLTSDTMEPLSPPINIDSPRSIDEAVLHNATIPELLEQQRTTKRAKKRLGKLLKEYEDDFYNMWNRKVQKDDRLPKEAEYREYKLIKSKLRLVEALIAKKAANNTV